MDTTDTAPENILKPLFQKLPDDNLVQDESDIEFFECQRCSEYNIITMKKRARRVTKVRHIRVNAVTWASFKRFASLNNVSLDYALMMLLYNAKTDNVNYLVNERNLVRKR